MNPSEDGGGDRPGPTRTAPQPFQRTITLKTRSGFVIGRVEDNVHDFTVEITHDDVQVLAITGEAHRVPWTSCPMAVHVLKVLLGAPLAGSGPRIDASHQCTHLFDLARLTIAQASRTGDRRYYVAITPGEAVGAARALLCRDGVAVLDWRLQDDVVTSGDPFVGHIASGRTIWPQTNFHADVVEAALILRRCLLIFWGRRSANADVERASELAHMAGACFSFQPARASTAVRPPGFTDYPLAPIRSGFMSSFQKSRIESREPSYDADKDSPIG